MAKYRYIILALAIVVVLLALLVRLYLLRHRLVCDFIGDKVQGVDTDLILNRKGVELDGVEFFITHNSGEYTVVRFDADQWVRIYFDEHPVVQVKFMSRLYDNPCKLVRQLTFTFGLPIEAVHIQQHGIVTQTTDYKRWLKIRLEGLLGRIRPVLLAPKVQTTLEDGTTVTAVGYEDILKVVRQYTELDRVKQEGIFVEVFNSTSKPGYATLWGRILQSLGFEVTRMGNYPALEEYADKYDIYLYYTNEVEGSYTLQVLQELFSGYAVYQTKVRPPYLLTTGDIVVILLR